MTELRASTWAGLNAGIRRLLILGYLFCIVGVALLYKASYTKRASDRIFQHDKTFTNEFFNEANANFKYREAEKAEKAIEDRKEKTIAVLVGHPVLVILGLWIYAGFRGRQLQ